MADEIKEAEFDKIEEINKEVDAIESAEAFEPEIEAMQSQQNDTITINQPIIRCSIVDPHGVTIVAGTTVSGEGFVMYKLESEGISPALILRDGCTEITKLYIDKVGDTYNLICCGVDKDGCINLIRCDNELNILNAVRVTDHSSPVTGFVKFGLEYVVTGIVYNKEKCEIKPVAIRVSDSFEPIKAVIFTMDVPEEFNIAAAGENLEGNEVVSVGVISQLCVQGENLICGGVVNNTFGQSYGFVSTIDSNYEPVNSRTFVSSEYSLTSINGITCSESGVIEILGLCRKDLNDNSPAYFKRLFDSKLEPYQVVETSESIQ